MKCEFCGDKIKNTYETESVFSVKACNKKKCKKEAVLKANKWRR
jgi:hypothetical protein